MPLTLITGPANAAKAGAVLERYRAALAREPLLVVPTPADAEHYGRELAAEGIVVGAEVVTFEWLVRGIARATGVPAARARLGRARARGPRGGGGHAAVGARSVGRGARLPGRGRRAVRRAWPLARDAGAVHERAAHLGGGRRCAAVRRGAGGAVLGLPPAARGARGGRRRRPRAGGAGRAARAAGGVGRPAGLPLRIRRPDAAAARRGRDPRPPRRRLRGAGVRARPRRVRRAGRHGARPRAAGRAPRGARRSLGALRAAGPDRAAPPRALAVRAGARAADAERRRAAARGGR